MYSFNESREIINNTISKINLSDGPAELFDPIKYTLSTGGKRLRPALVLMSCELFSGKIDKAIMPALGIEMFHNFTLLHDDIMDKSLIRRNKPTVHKKWNENIAILSGDVMSILSYKYITKCNEEILPSVIDLFNQTAIMVCKGQQHDMNFEALQTVTVDEYLNMIELKTSVLIAASIKLGALIGGANQTDTNLMYNFGKNLGMAFQIQDDMLDVYGVLKNFGKKPGGDIIANKKTYLLVKALEIASSEQKTRIYNQLKKKDFDPDEKISSILSVYNKLNIKDITEGLIKEYLSKSKSELEKVSLDNYKKEQLMDLFEILLNRNN
ncbi:MAG: polyprenyl synthetase family protein [Bacteroidetes bacterium]|nr:polyprenyl synthetase family protein [Bacteroidota bacterium]